MNVALHFRERGSRRTSAPVYLEDDLETKPSPGPWSIRWTCSGASIYDPLGRRVAYTSAPAMRMGRDEVAANATAIAALPELMEEHAALIHDLERVMTRENRFLNALMAIVELGGEAGMMANEALQ